MEQLPSGAMLVAAQLLKLETVQFASRPMADIPQISTDPMLQNTDTKWETALGCPPCVSGWDDLLFNNTKERWEDEYSFASPPGPDTSKNLPLHLRLEQIRERILAKCSTEPISLQLRKNRKRCKFCEKNEKESDRLTPEMLARIVSSHELMDMKGLVTCPFLKEYRCPLCGATGSRAHTLKYCPKAEDAPGEMVYLARRMVEEQNARDRRKIPFPKTVFSHHTKQWQTSPIIESTRPHH